MARRLARLTLDNLGDLPLGCQSCVFWELDPGRRQRAADAGECGAEKEAWVQVDGTAEVLDIPESVEPLVDYFRAAAGKEHPDWDEYRAAMVEQGKSIVRITIERWGPVATGGFPARLAEG